MSKPSNHEQRLARFRRVHPELPPLSEAPDSPYQAMQVHKFTHGSDRDAFYERWYAQESLKYYKTIDGSGNVWKLKNPAVDRWEQRDSGKPIKYSPRIFLGYVDDIQTSAPIGYDRKESERAPW
jgi:hypothetical protein